MVTAVAMPSDRTRVEASTRGLVEKLDRLRTELIELAYTLDTRGQPEAADVAITTFAYVGELCEELAAARKARSEDRLVSSS